MKNFENISAEKIADEALKTQDTGKTLGFVFDYFGFNCMARSLLDSTALDTYISTYSKSHEKSDLISLVSFLKNATAEREKAEKRKLIGEIKKVLENHATDDETMESIASGMHLSYHYFCHFFKQETGQTPNNFRTVKKLEIAIKMMLSAKDIKITDVASACGFNNVGYFSEIFAKYVGESPSAFKKKMENIPFHSFYTFEDFLLSLKMPGMRFLSPHMTEDTNPPMDVCRVHDAGGVYGRFLHEAAIIEYDGVLYASWYNCDEKELIGYTPIRERRSRDGGKTWSKPNIIAADENGKILFCPPVYGICDGKLYLLLNQMVAPDHIHSLDLYVLNKETDKFELLWSRPIPFKLNTNVVALPNGKLLLPGRVGKLDEFPNTPAVLISDSGKIDAEWRLVNVAPNGILADGTDLVFPETTVICFENILYMFSRNDKRGVPLVYTSSDFGETWSKGASHDIPYISSKIYSGKLSDGRYYLIANTDRFDRRKLVLYISEKEKLSFTSSYILSDTDEKNDIFRYHYPAATESDGKLYIIATAERKEGERHGRGAEVFVLPIKDI